MTKYISIRQVLDNLMDNPLLQDLSLERAVNYAVRFIQKVGMPSIFLEKTEKVEIENYRGKLPCDFYEMIQVRAVGHNCNGVLHEVFRYSTDSFHMSPDKTRDNDLTYKLQGSCIFTSMKEGTIEVAYRAFSTDEEGFPLIPENGSFEEALELFIKVKHFTVQFELGRITQQVLQHAEQQYAWAVGQAQSDLVRPSIDQLQSFTNSWNTLISRTNEHSKGFKTLGSKEYIKLH
jgi:hypothetical protein|nr:MAG TPA: hypothetical protein [Crassvirales sp.]